VPTLNYGAGTKEQQMNNYSKKKELEVQRLDMFDEGIALYNKADYGRLGTFHSRNFAVKIPICDSQYGPM
jgi:hypothetical protein